MMKTVESQHRHSADPSRRFASRLVGREESKLKETLMFRGLLIYALLLFVAAFCFARPADLILGMEKILLSPSVLLTDYMLLAGSGAAFLNSALLTLLSVLMIRAAKVRMNGGILAAVLTLSGFSFFGKNIVNSIPITLGVMLYSRFMNYEFRSQILVALYGTTLGPLVSTIAFGFGLPLWKGLILGYLCGIVTGFILPPLAASFVRFHQGFSLYNIGFTAGIIGMIMVGLLHFAGFNIVRQTAGYSGNTAALTLCLLLFYALLLFAGLWLHNESLASVEIDGQLKIERRPFRFRNLPCEAYGDLLSNSGRLVADFPTLYGLGVTLVNMALTGLIALAYALLIAGVLNGPTMGGILTVTGFAAFGKHPRNILPILFGVFLLNSLTAFDQHSTLAVMAGLFGTTLAPIAGHYGVIAGILAGMAHMAIVVNVVDLHAGVNLYNNGFSGGFVAAFLVPILDLFYQKKLLPFQWRQRRRERKEATAPAENFPSGNPTD